MHRLVVLLARRGSTKADAVCLSLLGKVLRLLRGHRLARTAHEAGRAELLLTLPFSRRRGSTALAGLFWVSRSERIKRYGTTGYQ